MPKKVTVYEVGPRDGLQNEPAFLPALVKVELVERLAAAGLPAVEVTSFVSPRAVPQLADAAEVFRAIRRREGTRYPVLVPNARGWEAAREAGAREVAVFTAASESFNRMNIGCGIERSFERFAPVFEGAAREGVAVRGYVSTAFHCPYEGRVAPEAVAGVARRLLDAGCSEISIGDTIGAAVPSEVHRLLDTVEKAGLPLDRVALHFHDTRGTAIANVVAGLERGIATFDSAAGGLGGCPFAPGAAGNLATEDLLWLLEAMGIETGVDFEEIRSTSFWLAGHLPGRLFASRLLRAGRPVPSGSP
jgi:isopropylmalate/homocitrate/citramalate synthase